MANRCASLDATWPHLPAPAPALWPYAAWFSPAASAFENDALASALAHASASPSSPTPSSSTTTTTTTTTTSSASELSSVPHDAAAHAHPVTCRPSQAGRSQAPHSTGRVSKRKPRASRRPPTTYITAAPADFRRMVQEITGFGVPGAEHACAVEAPRRPDPLAFVLPTLDTSACFLLDQAPPPKQRWEDKTSGGAATGMATVAADAGTGDSSLLLMQELEAMMSAPAAVSAAFPTLESWGMI